MQESKPEQHPVPEQVKSDRWVSPLDVIPDLKSEGLVVTKDLKALSAMVVRNTENLRRKVGVYADTTTLETPYASTVLRRLHDLEKSDTEVFQKLKKKFEGKVLVDLGAGGSALGFQVAVLLGASAYVAVEPYNTFRLADTLDFEVNESQGVHLLVRDRMKEGAPSFSVVAEDSLTFLKRLPDRSVNIFSSGTDNNIIPDRGDAEANAKEIARVVDEAALFYDSVFDLVGNETGFTGIELEKRASMFSQVPKVVVREV